MENSINKTCQPVVECHNDYLEILKGEYTCSKEGVKVKKENWKKYLFVLQDVKGVYSNFMVYKKSSKNWKSETPKYKFDLTDGKFEIKMLPFTLGRYLFEIYIEEKDTRFLVSAKDEETRNDWVYRLNSTRIMDPFSNDGTVYLVKVLETLDIRKFHLTGVCYLHVIKDRLLLSRTSDRCLLADWPLQVVRFYASSQDLLKIELGRKSMHGEMIIYFQTNRAKELFRLIKTAIHESSGQFEELPKEIPTEVKNPLVASAEYATVNLRKKAERRLQIEQTKSAVGFRKFYTPPPPPPPQAVSDYESVTMNIEEIEKHFPSPSVASRDVTPFEPFEEYDTLQHMRSAFGGSRSCSSQSDNSESDSNSNSGEYSFLRLSPDKSPPHQLVAVCSGHDHTIDSSLYPDPEYSTIDSPKIPKSYSSDLLATTEKEVVSNVWSFQSRGPLPRPPHPRPVHPRKKTSGVDENITNALESLIIPDNIPPKPKLETPNYLPVKCEEAGRNENQCIARKIHRRNGTRQRNNATTGFQPKCRTNIISYYEQPFELSTPNSTKALAY